MRTIPLLIFVLALVGCEQSTEPNPQLQKMERQILELREDVASLSSLRTKVKELESENSAMRSILVAHRLGESALATAQYSFSGTALDDPFLGEKESDVLVLAFFDFTCRPCRSFYKNTFPKLESEFTNNKRIRFVLRDFPIKSKAHSSEAAVLANCIGEQGKYWDGFRALMNQSNDVDSGNFSAIIENIAELDKEQLRKCRESGKFEREIEADIADAVKLGAKGSPGFFLGRRIKDRSFNGVFLRGAQPFPVFQQQLLKLLKAPQ